MVCIAGIFFDDGDDGCGIGEAGEIVNVSMSIVSGDAAFQPENIRYAKIIAEELFVIAFFEAGIAFLNPALQAFFGGEERAAAVDVDGAALENDAAAIVRRQKDFAAESFVGACDGLRVLLMVWIFCPAIKKKMIEGDSAGIVCNADRTGVAHPAPVRRNAKELEGIEVNVRFFQDGFDAGFRGGVFDEKKNAFNARKVAHDFGEGPGNRSEFTGPVGQFVRPAEERAFVGREFRRHTIIQRMRRGTILRFRHDSRKEKNLTHRARRTQRLHARQNHSPSQRLRMGW